MTSFFFKLENRDSEVSQTKNFRVRYPPFYMTLTTQIDTDKFLAQPASAPME